MAAKSSPTFEFLKSEIRNRNFSPIYLFMGEESYFIDELTELLENSVLPEEQRDFNQQTFYGIDSDVREIISLAKRFPMMADYQVIIIKEAQNLDKFELLENYAKNPLNSTILIIAYKGGNVDKRKATYKAIDKVGVIFESKKIYESKVPAFVKSYFDEKKIAIEPKAAQMLADKVGSDLSKLKKELEKLEVSLGNNKRITDTIVEQNIGISKDYNNYELKNAIVEKNYYTAQLIVSHFGKNPKEYPIMATIATLFNYFSNLLECYWLPVKNENTIMQALNVHSSYFVKEYITGLQKYKPQKVMEIISIFRTYDAKSKGFENPSNIPQGELLQEMVYKIMH